MGDAAREPAHRVHLLRLTQLHLEHLVLLLGEVSLGDVARGAVHHQVAVPVALGLDVLAHPALAARFGADAELVDDGLALLEPRERRVDRAAVDRLTMLHTPAGPSSSSS